MSRTNKPRRLFFECLESRKVLSVILGNPSISFDELDQDAVVLRSGDAKPAGPSGPAIDLATVALHEIGHALGLQHSTSSSCGTTASAQPIMCPYYLGASFSLKDEDLAKIAALYPDVPNSDSDIVFNPNDNRWDNPAITYSFMPDGSGIDQGGRGGSNLNATLEAKIGSGWQAIFTAALSKWADATGNDTYHVLQFTALEVDSGASFNVSGLSQGDSRFGDIRFGGHKFDSVGGTLAHTYYPPPNGATAAGDSHYASEENWKNLSSVALSSSTFSSGSTSSSVVFARGSSEASGAGKLRSMDTRLVLDDTLVEAIFATWSAIGGQTHGLDNQNSATLPAPQGFGGLNHLSRQPQLAHARRTRSTDETSGLSSVVNRVIVSSVGTSKSEEEALDLLLAQDSPVSGDSMNSKLLGDGTNR